MVKKFSVGISFVLILSLTFALGAAAVDDSPLAGGMIVDDGPLTNDMIVDDSPFANDTPSDETIVDDELTDDIPLAETPLADDELADDSGELLVDIEIEADTSEQFNVRINPKTGDNTMLFVVLAMVSLAILGVGAYFAKRSKE